MVSPMDTCNEEVLPSGLPEPQNDHACDHLWGMTLPSIPLRSTLGTEVDVSALPGYTVVFCYPRTGKPKEPVPADWDAIPGARGCTPQVCSFNGAKDRLKQLGVAHIFGLNTQDTETQRGCRDRFKLGYDMLSDEHFKFCELLRLPMFEWGNWRLVKRVTLLVDGGKIVWVDYPIFPADSSAGHLIEYMKTQPINTPGGGRCAVEEGKGGGAASQVPGLPGTETSTQEDTEPEQKLSGNDGGPSGN